MQVWCMLVQVGAEADWFSLVQVSTDWCSLMQVGVSWYS